MQGKQEREKRERMDESIARRSFLKGAIATGAVGVTAVASMRAASALVTSPAQAGGSGATGKRVKKIAIEEHIFPKGYSEILLAKTGMKNTPPKTAAAKAVDYGEGRIKVMDECGIDMQVISLSYPALEPFKAEDAIAVSRMVNDEISETVKKYPTRFAGFCCLPLQDPNAAADELERAVTKLGLKAAMINENTPERWLSDPKFEVLFERMAKLDVPLYLHADGPNLEDSGLHIVPEVMRLVNSDLLVRYPNLQFILGHAGESLPFWLNRLDGRWRDHPDRPIRFTGYFKKNFYVTTSSQCWPALLQFLIAAVGSDRIMFATDYPYEVTKQAVDFIDSAPISDSDREKICHLNAERLLRL